MSRASAVYLAMIVVFVAGLWCVMAAGGRLSAPEDLSGRWVATAGGPWPGLTVAQSGMYFQMAFDDGPADVAVTVVDRSDDGGLSLARERWHVTVDGANSDAPGTRTFHVDGPASGTFTGRRAGPTTAPVGKEAK